MAMTSSALQTIVHDWGVRAFGREHMANLPIRGLRCAEEAIELAQVLCIPKEQLHQLIDAVYSKPKGKLDQEIGGVLVTITAICVELGSTTDEYLLKETLRVLQYPVEYYKARNKAKIDAGFTADSAPRPVNNMWFCETCNATQPHRYCFETDPYNRYIPGSERFECEKCSRINTANIPGASRFPFKHEHVEPGT